MAISLSGLFADLGKLMGAFVNANGFAGLQANTPSAKWGANGPVVKAQTTMLADIETRLQGSGLNSVLNAAQSPSALLGLDTALTTLKTACVADATAVLIARVNNDVPQSDPTSLQLALVELIRQIQVQSGTVQVCVVSSTVTAGSGNVGNAVVYASLLDPNGLTLENALPETLTLRCAVDQNHGAVAGSETIAVTSRSAVNSSSYLWPGGSALNTTITVVDPTQGNGGGANLLTGDLALQTVGAFKAFGGAVPIAWSSDVDAINVADGTTTAYAGASHCLKFIGNTAGTNLQTSIFQNFANLNAGVAQTGGSTQALAPNTVYNFCARVKADVVPAAGVLKFSLTDGAGTVINNNNGVANTITSTISGFGGTTYQTVTGSFQTPSTLPTTGVRLRVKATTPITTGSNVFVDFIALTLPASNSPSSSAGLPATSGASPASYGGLYAGGPYLSAFRGSADLVQWQPWPALGDSWAVAIANDFGSTSPTPLSLQTLFFIFFNMPALGLVLPSGGSPTIANSVIS